MLGLTTDRLALFTLASLVLAATPGPVWLYLISRTLAQGRRAGYFSMFGVAAGLSLHATFAAFGLTVVLLAVPFAFDAIKLAGAAYLLWLAYTTVRGAASRSRRSHSIRCAIACCCGRLSSPRSSIRRWRCSICRCSRSSSIRPAGRCWRRACCSARSRSARRRCGCRLVTVAGLLAAWFARRPSWLHVQRWFLGSAFGALAVWLR